jgi:CRISPR-associated endonuclease/helicase Cas3
MKFYSHHEILLKDHLREVGERSKEYFYFENEDNSEKFRILSYYIGLTHDFGKYTTYFQNKLFNEDYQSKYSDHSLISSLFSSYYVFKNLDKFNLDDEIKKFLPLITFFVVIHHHSDLKSLQYLKDILKNQENIEKINKQMEDMIKNKSLINEELKENGINLEIENFYDSFEELKGELLKESYFYEKLEEDLKIKISFIVLILFSSLIDADKKSAGRIDEVDRAEIPADIIDKYKKIKFKSSENSFINKVRNEIYEKVINEISKIDLNKKIYTLTSPTGSGKTLTAFSFAFKLRSKIKEKFGYLPRIVYSLPFISIINQNFQVLEDVLSIIEDYKGNKSKYLISHHHLSNTKYEEGNELKEIDESLELIESWESEIIVTTFVQFLETIIGFKNRFLKKYHNIAKSIIILDEVQNIPIEYWDLIEKILFYLTKYLNCYIILMTATKPLLFNNIETIELLDDNEKYFKNFNRVLIQQKFDLDTLDKLEKYFLEIFEKNKSKSFMFVFNTINISIEFYNKLKSHNFIKNLYYLSSNIIPKHRIERINEIKEKLKINDQIFLVSTQVVEAGVDISFNIVFRDIAPFDSIVQVAGRCNREFKEDKGDAYIVMLNNERGNLYASFVYGKISPNLSYVILKNSNKIEEKDLFDFINSYFNEIKDKKSQEESENIFKSLINLNFYDKYTEYSVSKFKLIENINVYPIYIEIDENSKNIWKKYKEIIENEKLKPWEKKIQIYNFRDEFENYIVSVRINEKNFKTLEIFHDEYLGYVPKDKVDKYYDIETGFNIKEGIYLIW